MRDPFGQLGLSNLFKERKGNLSPINPEAGIRLGAGDREGERGEWGS